MVGVTGALIGSAVIGAASSAISGSKAAKAQKSAANAANETERYIYDTTRADYAPFREVGYGALGKLADMYGVSRSTGTPALTSTAPANGGIYNQFGIDGFSMPAESASSAPAMTAGFDGFKASPGYQFRLSEGLKAIERSAAARGNLRSGATMKSIGRFADGTASSEYENFANRLAALAGVGQSATSSTAQAGQQFAQGFGQNTMAAGNARASGYQNTGNAINQGVGNLASAYLYNQGYGKVGAKS